MRVRRAVLRASVAHSVSEGMGRKRGGVWGWDLTSRHMRITIRRDANTHVQPRHVTFEVGVHVVWVDGMGDVRAEEEAVGVGLGEDIGAIGR